MSDIETRRTAVLKTLSRAKLDDVAQSVGINNPHLADVENVRMGILARWDGFSGITDIVISHIRASITK